MAVMVRVALKDRVGGLDGSLVSVVHTGNGILVGMVIGGVRFAVSAFAVTEDEDIAFGMKMACFKLWFYTSPSRRLRM